MLQILGLYINNYNKTSKFIDIYLFFRYSCYKKVLVLLKSRYKKVYFLLKSRYKKVQNIVFFLET